MWIILSTYFHLQHSSVDNYMLSTYKVIMVKVILISELKYFAFQVSLGYKITYVLLSYSSQIIYSMV